MHIGYVGNFDPPHSTENDITSALQRLGHRVTRHQEHLVDWPTLAAVSLVEDPVDLLLWTRTASLDAATGDDDVRHVQAAVLDKFRDAGVPTAGYHLDLFWGLQARSDREMWIARLPFFQGTDWMFTADGGHPDEWADIGVNHVWLPPGIAGHNVDMVGVPGPKWKADIGFVGSWRDYHPEWPHRRQVVSWVNNRYPRKMRIWEGGVRGQDLADLYATVGILIGDSCMIAGTGYYWSDRIPETLGRGGFLLHPDTEGLRDHFPEGTLVTWPLGDFKELRYLLDYYLDHPAEASTIAAAGKMHVAEHHTYERRMEQVFDTIGIGDIE